MKFFTLAIFAALVALASCKERDLGTGINTIERTYAKPMNEVWDASLAAVRDSNLAVDSESHDDLGGTISAHRATGERVTVSLRNLGNNQTEVSVRVEPGDRALAQLVHDRIAGKLGIQGTY
jgi:hypothetical protein